MQEDALIRTTNGSTAELDVPAIDHSFRALREVDLPALRLGLGGGEQVTQFVRGAGAPPRLRARTPSAGPLRRCRGGDVGSRRGWARPGFPRLGSETASRAGSAQRSWLARTRRSLDDDPQARLLTQVQDCARRTGPPPGQCPVTHPLAARRHLRARDPPGPLLLQPPSAQGRSDRFSTARRGKQSRWASECDLPAASSPERTSSSPPVPAGSGAQDGADHRATGPAVPALLRPADAPRHAQDLDRARGRGRPPRRNERDATGERSAALGRVLAAAGGPGLAI